MYKIQINKDFAAGILFLAISLFSFFLSSQYNIGTGRRMGPAFFPVMVGGLLGLLSVLLIIRGLKRSGVPVGKVLTAAPLLILGSIALFVLTLHPLGLPAAIIIMVLVSSLASKRMKLLPTCILAVTLAVSSTIVFKFGLSQSLPVCGWLFAEQLCPAHWS